MSDSPADFAACASLRRENEELRRRLQEAEEALSAIRQGEVDAIVVDGAEGAQVFSLNGAETIYRLAVETMAEAALNLAPDGRILFCNARFGEFVNLPLPQVLGQNLVQFVDPDQAATLRRFLADCLARTVQQRMEFRAEGGGLRAALVSGRALDHGGFVTVGLLAADVTEWERSLQQLHELREQRERMKRSQEELAASRSAALNLMEDALDAQERAEASALALQASEERFRGTFENAAVGMAHVDLEGFWLRVNQKLCEITGYREEELLGKSFAEITHPQDLESDWAQAHRVKDGEIPHYTMDKRYVRKDGSFVWVGLTVSLERRFDGTPDYFITVIRDISDRKRFEAELRESELFVRRVLDNLSVFVAVVSPDGNVIDLNRTPLEEAGLRPESVVGRKFWDAYWWTYDPDVQVLIRDSLHRAMGGDVVRYDTIMRISAEQRIWIDLQIAPLRDHQGEITHLIFSAMDITGRRQAEIALQASEERLRLAAQATGFGSYDYDPLQDRAVWSPELYLITGVPWTEAPCIQRMWSLVHPDDRSVFENVVRRKREPGEEGRHELEFRIVRPCDGEVRWVRDVGRSFIVADDGGEEANTVRVVGTIQDITRRKHAELQLEASLRFLEEAQDQLVRRERLATLGQLAGGVAHELRTPLGVIRNAVYYLEHVLPPTEVMQQVLGEMQRAIGSSDHIIGEMLDFVREPSRERTEFPVGRAISAALHLVPLPAGVTLNGPSGAVESQVSANEDQITRILVNLLQNGIQAMDGMGKLDLEVKREDGDREGRQVSIFVRDTGCGIPADNLARIFDPLFTTKTKGIGLGLAISMRYAQMNDGGISVESEVGVGTAFCLYLRGVASES